MSWSIGVIACVNVYKNAALSLVKKKITTYITQKPNYTGSPKKT